MFLLKLLARKIRALWRSLPGLSVRLLAARQGGSIHSSTVLDVEDAARVHLGRFVNIAHYNIIVVTDEHRPGAVTGSELHVGDRTYIGAHNNIRAAGGTIRIGSNCLISQHVTIVGSNHGTARGELITEQPWDTSRVGVTLGDDVWVGANSVLLPGIQVGRGAIVAAGSVVTKDVPEYAVVGGVPARTIGQRQEAPRRQASAM